MTTAEVTDLAPARAWRRAHAATGALAGAVLALVTLRVFTHDQTNRWVRLDTVGLVMLALVALVGWVVVRYSSRYLAGDPRQARAARRLLATIAAVVVVVMANDLVLLAAAWTVTSLALHGLLTHFGDRPAAVTAAHKKFVVARLADACMVGAIASFAVAFGTTRIDTIVDRAAGASALPAAAGLGISLLVAAAVLKSAQLPFHGWLIQVMEAPTPVSALLHAGVVNLGGFVLLRFAPAVDRVTPARVALVVIGTTTAVVAALVMSTRVSVKVALAWSTCAQMGFMLAQAGLGLWEMVLLHLVAHSLYKARTFLRAGSTVRDAQRQRLLAHAHALRAGQVVAGIGLAAAITAGVTALWLQLPAASPLSDAAWVFVGMVALALVPLTAPAPRLVPAALGRAAAVPAAYLAVHEIATRLVPHGSPAPLALVAVLGAAVALLFAVQTVVAVAPGSSLVRRLRPWLYSGLFLDEAFTRVAFAVWPPPSPARLPSLLPQRHARPTVPTRATEAVTVAG